MSDCLIWNGESDLRIQNRKTQELILFETKEMHGKKKIKKSKSEFPEIENEVTNDQRAAWAEDAHPFTIAPSLQFTTQGNRKDATSILSCFLWLHSLNDWITSNKSNREWFLAGATVYPHFWKHNEPHEPLCHYTLGWPMQILQLLSRYSWPDKQRKSTANMLSPVQTVSELQQLHKLQVWTQQDFTVKICVSLLYR